MNHCYNLKNCTVFYTFIGKFPLCSSFQDKPLEIIGWPEVLLDVLDIHSGVIQRQRNPSRETFLRPDSTTAKFLARNCLCEIRMFGHE